MMPNRFDKTSCGLCERPVTGVHYLWDTLTGRETIIWFHDDEDQCFKNVPYVQPVIPNPDIMESSDDKS